MSLEEYLVRFFNRHDADEKHHLLSKKLNLLQKLEPKLVDIRDEFCYYVASSKPLTQEEQRQILWLIEPNCNDYTRLISDEKSHLKSNKQQRESDDGSDSRSVIVEIGPRLNFCSPFSTNAVSMLKSSCPATSVYRLERSTIFELVFSERVKNDTGKAYERLYEKLYDKMVETIYPEPVQSFNPNASRAKVEADGLKLEPTDEIDILAGGEQALLDINTKLGLFFDSWDIKYYVKLFKETIKRNPTVVECFDLAQSNSEHSRHWFFKGILEIEGRQPVKESLIDMVIGTQANSNQNNVIKFEDNSSAIKGFAGLTIIAPSNPSESSRMVARKQQHRHILFTAETHNFPTGVAPFPGAATGTGGRIRDVQATGRGAHVIAGTAGYSFGNLLLDDHELDWENPHELYPNKLAPPHRIAIEASDGASDYGNKFGEPIVAGFARSFGLRLNSTKTGRSERWEYLKPIMFTGGIGSIDDHNITKVKPEKDMIVVKAGGPVYRIGMGGGAASSAPSGGRGDQLKTNDQLDFNAVQRGDPEMEQKLNRVVRAFIENQSVPLSDDIKANPAAAADAPVAAFAALSTAGITKKSPKPSPTATINYNPILSIHDQGAGGNGNVLKEIVEPLGATIDANKFTLGDNTVNILELWAAEYQESNAMLLDKSDACQKFIKLVSAREKCKVDQVGRVDGSGQIKLINFGDADKGGKQRQYPIALDLDHVIGSVPRKVFKLQDYSPDEFASRAKLVETDAPQKELESRYRLPDQIYTLSDSSQMTSNFEHLLTKVLKLPSVGSKRYLTTKVDRCVSGLIAGQQCLGPLHSPIGDYALVALSHFDYQGAVTSIGEQPIKGLVSPISNATMSVAEALTNMMFCVITSLKDVKCSANWMWPAKLPGEGAKLLDTCKAMCELMAELGIAVDGGKDSLSMSAHVDPQSATKLMKVTCDDSEDDTDETVKSPGTLVISAYAPVPDIRCKVTPILSCQPKRSHLIYVNLAHPLKINDPTLTGKSRSLSDAAAIKLQNKFRLGGSAILQTLGQIGEEAPNIDHPELLREGFNLVQDLIKEGICTAGHDVSDGGLIVCALEMAIVSHCGIHLNIKAEKAFRELSCANNDEKVLGALFSEECAVIIEVNAETEAHLNLILERFEQVSIQAQRIGFGSYENQRVTIKFEQQLLMDHENNHKLRNIWESTSRQLDLRQANSKCVKEEYDNISLRPNKPNWSLSFDPNETKLVLDFPDHYLTPQPKVAVLREEGINGDREMMASLMMAGFEVFDLTMTDLSQTKARALNSFNGLIFPGGFSYADVFGSARGWAASFIFNQDIKNQLIQFRRRPNSFSLGVCNGCQLMSLLGFLEDAPDPKSNKLIDIPETTIRLEPNTSGRFECRFVNVRIEPTTDSIMLKDMEESTLGVWVAHGEGKFKIEQNFELDSESRVALKYVDDSNEPTMEYPLNPNGSDLAAAGVCSRDGRHLAMMPHPERCTQLWQWPYLPPQWTSGSAKLTKSPWMQMFVNAYDFCKNSL